MATYSQLLYQIVFSTKDRVAAITREDEKRLYRYIWEVLKSRNCHVYQIGGVEDHLHIVTHVHPSVAIANLVKEIKVGSAKFIKEEELFPKFHGWQIGYGVFSYSLEAKDNLIEYVKNQKVHHLKVTSKEELIVLLKEHGVEYDEKYLV